MAEVLHAGVGDRITMRPTKGQRRERTVPVVAIADTYLGMSVYADIGYLSRLVGEEFVVSGLQLKTDPSPAAQDAFYRQLKRLPTLASVDVRTEMVQNLVSTMVDTNRVFIVLVVLFSGTIFFGSILNASLVSLAERQREVATLRVLGYSERQIGILFLKESMLVNLLGTLLGLPLGYGLSLVFTWAYNTEMFRFPLRTPPQVWLNTLALATLFALAAHWFVQRQINRMNVLGALNVKE
jgi:putative ABC transport system permease protein